MYFFAFVFQAFQDRGETVFKSLNKKKQAIFFSLLRKVVIVVPLNFVPYLGFGTMGGIYGGAYLPIVSFDLLYNDVGNCLF